MIIDHHRVGDGLQDGVQTPLAGLQVQARPLAAGDVAQEDQGPRPPLVQERHRRHLGVHAGPVQAQAALLHHGHRLAALVQAADALPDLGPVSGVETVQHRLAQQLVGRIRPEQAQRGLVGIGEALIGLDEDGLRRVLHQGLEAGLALAQPLQGPQAVPELPHRLHQQGQLAQIGHGVVRRLVGHRGHRDQLRVQEDRDGANPLQRRMPGGALATRGKGVLEVVDHQGRPPLPHLLPDAGVGQRVDSLGLVDPALLPDPSGPGVELNPPLILPVVVDVAQAAVGERQGLLQGVVQKLLLGVHPQLGDAQQALQPGLLLPPQGDILDRGDPVA